MNWYQLQKAILWLYCTIANELSKIYDPSANFVLEKVSNILCDIDYSTTNFVDKNIRYRLGEEVGYAILKESDGFSKDNLPLLWLTHRFCSEIRTGRGCQTSFVMSSCSILVRYLAVHFCSTQVVQAVTAWSYCFMHVTLTGRKASIASSSALSAFWTSAERVGRPAFLNATNRSQQS